MGNYDVVPTASSQLSCKELKRSFDLDISCQWNQCISDEDLSRVQSHKHLETNSFYRQISSNQNCWIILNRNGVSLHSKNNLKASCRSLSAASSPLIQFRPAARFLTFQSGRGSLSVWWQNKIFFFFHSPCPRNASAVYMLFPPQAVG